jgi:hypothetical protein
LTLAAMAAQYAKLKDGTIIILKDDGTWEKVEALPKESVPLSENSDETGKKASENRDTAMAREKKVSKPLSVEVKRYREKLQGHWANYDDSLQYDFKGDTVTFIDGRRKRSGKYEIEKINPKNRTFLLNIAEHDRSGSFSFGGVLRRLGFSDDFKTMTDYSAPIPTELSKK